ncbi:MAG: hypothetical protein Q7R56_01790 [Nanoarchaeota archaeon]|nr:hypothetical protein [Nanoarchaeota archaeon]
MGYYSNECIDNQCIGCTDDLCGHECHPQLPDITDDEDDSLTEENFI